MMRSLRAKPNVPDAETGILLIAHGTRDDRGIHEVRQLWQAVESRLGGGHVGRGFIEIAEPTIMAAVDDMVERGVRRIVMVPLLLFMAGHGRRDIPQAVSSARVRHPSVEFAVAPHLGAESGVLELSVRRISEALQSERLESSLAHLMVVGRGSSENGAKAAFFEFVESCRRKSGCATANGCFAAVAKPSIEQGVQAAIRSNAGWVVVLPHLLFRGRVLDDVRQRVQQATGAGLGARWILANHLGPHGLLAESVERTAIKTLNSLDVLT